MAEITAKMVKDLREATGAGMMDCKTALNETGGNMDEAIDWLRKKGLSKAAKKAGRTASEGLVQVTVLERGTGAAGIVVEVNSETDFVARNEIFQSMVSKIGETALAVDGDFDQLKAKPFPDTDKTVEEHVAEMVGQIGENMSLRRSEGVTVDEGVVASYIHGQVAEGAGKIGVVVGLQSAGDKEKLMALGKQIAMHIAAANPLAARIDDLDPDVVDREKSILSDQARASGKPEEIIEKMVEGRLRKFYEESVLLEQVFVIDGENRVGKVIDTLAADLGTPVALTGFVRFALGDGIEKSDDED